MANETQNFLNNAGLGFNDVKYNFINFLKNQAEFSDYNLEGSNITVLLDILAYNTSQQGFYNTMVANEMFIDRATKRSSVVSLAKLLGYTPSTKKASKAKVLVTVTAANLPANGVLTRGSVFTGSINNNEYSFTNTDAYAFYPYTFNSTSDPDAEENGEIVSYACGPVELSQGALNTISYNVESYDQIFAVSDTNADKTSIRVFVMNSVTDTTGVNIPWFLSNDLTSLKETSKIFFLEENSFGQLVLKFGDGVLGKKLETGNIVIIEYLSTAGSEANNIGSSDTDIRRSFVYDGDETLEVLTIEASNSGGDKESSSSIRSNAVRNYTSRERAVTVNDYEGLLLGSFNDNAAVRCWGGEENDPPYYGKVFVSVRPIGQTSISSSEKTNLITNVLKSKNIVGMDIVVVDPEVLYIHANVAGFYDKNATNDTSTSISKKIRDSLIIYFRKNLVEFGDSVFAQDVETSVKSVSSSLRAVDVSFSLERRIIPTIGVSERVAIDFQNPLHHPHDGHQSIVKTNSFYIATGSGSHYIEDDGSGKLILKKKQGGVITTANSNYGTIDYTTGKLVVTALKVSGFIGDQSYIKFVVEPSTSNVFTTRNTILEFDSLDSDALTIALTQVQTQRVVGGSGSVISKSNNSGSITTNPSSY